ncbi:MAG: aminopeptidase [Sedimentisphaerales bacterium]|nr:aminopeptidase [Sedimentisphaerales bacterium]
MGTLADGVRQAVENCLKVKAGERAVIITDTETRRIGDALRTAVREITERIDFFVMEDFGTRPIPFPPEVAQAMAAADVSIYAAQGAKGELATFRQPMIKTIEANKKLRHAHMIGITEEIMCDGMCSDYVEIQRVSKLVYERVKDAKTIRVATDKGCDFTAGFSPSLKWTISDGDVQPGRWKNLPDGEVFTSPVTLNGTVVIDGCLGDFFTEKYGSLAQTPVTVEVKDGRALRETLRCDNEQLLTEFGQYVFETDENSSRVGEFAIGTNTGLTKLIYNLLQDEKFPGVHIAFGSPLPGKTGAKWDSKAHVDGVIIAPTITVDGKTLMEKGRFRL